MVSIKNYNLNLLRCQGFAVPPRRDGFTLGRLGSGASSTFAPLRYEGNVKIRLYRFKTSDKLYYVNF
jgi:hypothetical protein